jgi:hypothetical protein
VESVFCPFFEHSQGLAKVLRDLGEAARFGGVASAATQFADPRPVYSQNSDAAKT